MQNASDLKQDSDLMQKGTKCKHGISYRGSEAALAKTMSPSEVVLPVRY